MIKIKPNDIAFDIDGVVADTMSSFIYVAKKEFGINTIKREQITSYWLEECLNVPEEIIKAIINQILEDPFKTRLRPIEGATETLGLLSEFGPIHFVTARPIKEPIEDWLKTVLKKVPSRRIKVHATGQHDIKPQVIKKLGKTFFLEDHLETCKAIHQAGLKAIVFDQPWNQGQIPFTRIKSWQELRKLLELTS